tara:strand:+ start:43465 stop:43623 length:159 start_codon:yes stop_codon:yes gene_type:complete
MSAALRKTVKFADKHHSKQCQNRNRKLSHNYHLFDHEEREFTIDLFRVYRRR